MARGLSGRLEMWDRVLPYCRFHTDIDKAAGLTIEEGDGLPRLRKCRFYPGGDAQDGDFASGGTPVAQTGKGRSGESPADSTIILAELPRCPAKTRRREQCR